MRCRRISNSLSGLQFEPMGDPVHSGPERLQHDDVRLSPKSLQEVSG